LLKQALPVSEESSSVIITLSNNHIVFLVK